MEYNENYEKYEKAYDPIEYKARKLKKIRLSLLSDDWAINRAFFGKDLEERNRPKERPDSENEAAKE